MRPPRLSQPAPTILNKMRTRRRTKQRVAVATLAIVASFVCLSIKNRSSTTIGHRHNDRLALSLPTEANSHNSSSSHRQLQANVPTQPYSVDNLLSSLEAFRRYGIFIFYYNPRNDEFLALQRVHDPPNGVTERLNKVMKLLTMELRQNFPNRFMGKKSEEFMVLISVADFPSLREECFPSRNNGVKNCAVDAFSPILQFGSIFTEKSILPTLMAMPMGPHIHCFLQWQNSRTVCDDLIPDYHENDVKWQDLIPQVAWRGTDFEFLPMLYPHLRQPDYEMLSSHANNGDSQEAVIDEMLRDWDNLYPRWRGMALTAQAELEASKQAKNDKTPPWINTKFTHWTENHHSHLTTEGEYYNNFEKMGIHAIGEYMDKKDLAKFRYQIDYGGGGGTTWKGTLEKLAMPGVLMHHTTATRDWFHEEMIPWGHYIPISEDLSNLRLAFEWAEAFPGAAERIATAGTEFVHAMGTEEVFGQMYDKYLTQPMGNIIDAFQPSQGSTVFSDDGKVMINGAEFKEMWRCIGTENDMNCQQLHE